MAVTGDIYKSLTFDGESSRDYGVYITGQAVYNAPERDVEMVTIPGRNGAFALDKGRFENIEVTYPAGVFANTETEFAKTISDFRNMLCSRVGYCRLTDEYNPDEYRLAVYKSGLEVDPVQLKAGQFDITFECKPQRYLTSGEEKKVLGTWGDTEIETGDIVEIDNTSGSIEVKSAVVALEPQQDLHGYDKPWAGGNGKNLLPYPYSNTTKVVNGITFTDNGDGTVKATGTASADATFYCVATSANGLGFLSNSTCKLNGCPSGGSYSTYELQVMLNGSTWKADLGSGVEFTHATTTSNELCRILVHSGAALPTGGVVFKPMIRLSTVTDATWEPYTNICPITGASDVDVRVSGKNLIDTSNAISGLCGYRVGDDINTVIASTRYSHSKPIPAKDGVVLSFKSNNTSTFNLAILECFDDNGKWVRAYTPTVVTDTTTVRTEVVPADTYKWVQVNYSAPSGGTVGTDIDGDIQLEYGDTATSYEPYNGNTYTTSLGTTVYGGSVDVVAGTGTEEWANIASYNGETITEPWLSSMDVYSAGATPTTGAQVVYKLSTPTDLSFTPQSITLNEGTNYVFSPQGEITVEYGTGPNFIINPTLFGCGPLIETKGYGNISFNGHTISLANGAIGTVNLWNRTSGGSLNGSVTKTFATGQFNPTDTFSFSVTHMFTLYEDNPSITNTNANATNSSSDNNDGSVTYIIQVPCTFTINTSGQITNKSTYTFGLKKVIADMTVSYNSTTGTVVYSVTTDTVNNPEFASTTQFGFTLWECNATSTLDRLGDPTYIDCDLGEAYKINDGDVVSLNSFVDLGSKLPELAPGNNEFTVSNTFTEVAVTPRWWTV